MEKESINIRGRKVLHLVLMLNTRRSIYNNIYNIVTHAGASRLDFKRHSQATTTLLLDNIHQMSNLMFNNEGGMTGFGSRHTD